MTRVVQTTETERLALDAMKRLGGEDRRYTIMCRGCQTQHALGAYGTAQLASGHNLTFKCPHCGKERPVLVRAFRQGMP